VAESNPIKAHAQQNLYVWFLSCTDSTQQVQQGLFVQLTLQFHIIHSLL